MFRIIKTDGTELGVAESVNYIKIHENGCFTTATKDDAIGVAYSSIPYNLIGHEDIVDAETVVVYEIDGGNEINAIVAKNNLINAQLAEVDEIAIELYEAGLMQDAINAEQDEAIIEIYEMMGGIV